MRPSDGDCEDASRHLMSRVRLLIAGNLQCGEGDVPHPWDPRRPPARCVFQFNGQDGCSESFPLEYILRLMASWAETACDPYVKIQNTGVSVLFQGYFSRPPGAPLADITAEQNNATLASTQSTGLSLSALEKIKGRGGIDPRPFHAMMSVSCFVRMPRVQLSFRFMGPGDSYRTSRLLDRVVREQLSGRGARARRSATRGWGPAAEPAPAREACAAAAPSAYVRRARELLATRGCWLVVCGVSVACAALAIARLLGAPF
ncbi:Virion egress protein UL34 [Caprine alphaherpesvirus 1]|uniref:Virion egress protein UL34 n=1 Tax=Caprine alphaherpesvirus 1 TaxID=39944 RepID=A0AAE5YI88_9ALPH|nr:Virion egress protein UL34 [Caprine alphaherpesvirus 1]QBM10866.1 Virion egress protein UL34 [Caprine alphaherpesvirus 1]